MKDRLCPLFKILFQDTIFRLPSAYARTHFKHPNRDLRNFLEPRKTSPSREVVYFSEKANGGRQRNSNIQQQQGRTQTQLGPRGLSSVIKAKILDDTANIRWTTRSFNCQNKPRTTIDLEAKELCKHHRRRYTATLGNAVSRVAVVIIVI